MHVTVQIDSRWREQASRKRDTTVTVPAVRIDHREQSQLLTQSDEHGQAKSR